MSLIQLIRSINKINLSGSWKTIPFGIIALILAVYYDLQSAAPTDGVVGGDTFYGVEAGTTNIWV